MRLVQRGLALAFALVVIGLGASLEAQEAAKPAEPAQPVAKAPALQPARPPPAFEVVYRTVHAASGPPMASGAPSIGNGLLPGTLKSTAPGCPAASVRVVVAFPPGGLAGQYQEIYLSALASGLKRSVCVEFAPGRAGLLAARHVADAKADGNTFLLASYLLLAAAHTYAKAPVDPLRDLAPVAILGAEPFVIVGGGSVRSIAALSAAAKGRTTRLVTLGPASVSQLLGEGLRQAAGFSIATSNARGAMLAVHEIASGKADFTVLPLSAVRHALGNGQVTALAVTSSRRSVFHPELPTAVEAGFPSLEVGAWHGLFAPSRTPPAQIARINSELRRVSGFLDTKERLAQNRQDPESLDPAAFGALLRRDSERWQAMAKRVNVRVE